MSLRPAGPGEEWWDGSCQQSTKESALLTLTENASTIVKSITAAQPGPETAGLRITPRTRRRV